MAIVEHEVVHGGRGSTDIKLPAAGGTALEGIRAKVFLDRYALKDEGGQSVEQYPEQMWDRVARGIASIEPTEEKRRFWSQSYLAGILGTDWTVASLTFTALADDTSARVQVELGRSGVTTWLDDASLVPAP